jgi:hypothetical protein
MRPTKRTVMKINMGARAQNRSYSATSRYMRAQGKIKIVSMSNTTNNRATI